MTPESADHLRLEIGHVLFIDLVGYSKLLIEEQNERLRQLTEIVLATAQVREAPNEELCGCQRAMEWHWSFGTDRRNRRNVRLRLLKRSRSTRRLPCGWEFTAGR